MAAEGVHLSALHESASRGSALLLSEVRGLVSRHSALTRLGAVLADLPYFEDPSATLARTALGLPRRASAWGDRLHAGGEEKLLAALLARVHDGRADWRRGGPGRESVLAVALGLASHLAVDAVTHPVSDQLARQRALARHTSERDEQNLVEGVQATLFHAEHGDARLADPRRVAAAELAGDPRFVRLIADAIGESTGIRPATSLLERWLRGYHRAALVSGSMLGRLALRRRDHDELREVFYDDVRFEEVFTRAEAASREALEQAYGRATRPTF